MLDTVLDTSALPGGMQLALNVGIALATILAFLWGFIHKKNVGDIFMSSSSDTLLFLLTSLESTTKEVLATLKMHVSQAANLVETDNKLLDFNNKMLDINNRMLEISTKMLEVVRDQAMQETIDKRAHALVQELVRQKNT